MDYSLYLITDREIISEKGLSNVVDFAIQGGVTAVQLREKKLDTKNFVELGKEIKKILDKKSIPLIINDRLDVALAVQAAGVHLGQNDLPYEDARKVLGPNYQIGLTVESMEQALEVAHLDFAYLGLSALFNTDTKREAKSYWTKKRVSELRKATHHKLIGVGGVNETNAREVMSWGLDGISVVSALCGVGTLPEVKETAIRLKEIVHGK